MSLSTIRRALATGALPHSRVGLGRGQVRIARAELDSWLEPRPAPRTPRRDEKGFTLIELLVVVIIIGILTAIAIPVFLNQKGKAHDAGVKAQVNSVAKMVETALVDASPGDAISSAGEELTVGTQTATVPTTRGVEWAVSGSGASGYCIASWSTAAGARYTSSAPLLYDSTAGGLLASDGTCAGGGGGGGPVVWATTDPLATLLGGDGSTPDPALTISINGTTYTIRAMDIDGSAPAMSPAEIVAAINAQVSALGITADLVGGRLRLTASGATTLEIAAPWAGATQ